MTQKHHFEGINAAEDLVGRELPGGWTVQERLVAGPEDTGGNFSVNYWVEASDGRRGFCKVLNYWWLLNALQSGGDPVEAMASASAVYLFERDLARQCIGLSRVITALDDGSFTLPNYAQPTVSFIIFEVADKDIRRLLDTSDAVDIAVRLRAIHNLATGLRQLHSQGVAHQDVKPSNTLVFHADEQGRRITKVGDLGRATVAGRPIAHDDLQVVGDPTYGPPEGLYHAVPDGFGPRRLACDLYQLGSMLCFVFTGAPLNALLKLELHPAHSWENWRGDFAEVLPYVRDAFGRCIDRVEEATPTGIRGRVGALLKQLCEPDPHQRGHTTTLGRPGSPYDLERIVAELDLLSRRAELGVRRSA